MIAISSDLAYRDRTERGAKKRNRVKNLPSSAEMKRGLG
jgi:hypothetical protein